MIIGYAHNVLTPILDKPVYLAGFGNNRRAMTVHDDLYARALAIKTESTTLVLVALDLIGFFRPDVQDVIRRVKTSEFLKDSEVSLEIVIASTHTHHGPDTMGLWGPDQKTRGVGEEYLADIKIKIADVILASLIDPKTASVKWTSVHVPGLSANFRNPEIVDHELTLAQFVGRDGAPLTKMFNFPCHPEVLSTENPIITSDYVGYLRDEVEKQTGAPCIFFAGALGGMLSPDVNDHSFEEAEFMGKKLAEEGVAALRVVDRNQFSVISVEKKETKAKLTNILYKLAL